MPDDALHHDQPSVRRTATILTVGLLTWLAPVALFAATTGAGSVYTQQGLFFSGTAMVTFGGAFAVLAFVAHRAVEDYGWLSAPDMVRGLAVVGVIANPGVYFAVHTLFASSRTVHAGPLHVHLPDLATVRPVPVTIAAVAAVLLVARGWPVLRVLAVSALLGVIAAVAGLPVT